MAYYPDADRLEAVLTHMRACDDRGEDVYQRELHQALGMNKNCLWKIVQTLVEDGRMVRIPTEDGPTGHKRLLLILEEWEKLTDVQKERMIAALERIAESQEALLRQGMGPVYNIGTATINNNPVPPRAENPEGRMRRMETKTAPTAFGDDGES